MVKEDDLPFRIVRDGDDQPTATVIAQSVDRNELGAKTIAPFAMTTGARSGPLQTSAIGLGAGLPAVMPTLTIRKGRSSSSITGRNIGGSDQSVG